VFVYVLIKPNVLKCSTHPAKWIRYLAARWIFCVCNAYKHTWVSEDVLRHLIFPHGPSQTSPRHCRRSQAALTPAVIATERVHELQLCLPLLPIVDVWITLSLRLLEIKPYEHSYLYLLMARSYLLGKECVGHRGGVCSALGVTGLCRFLSSWQSCTWNHRAAFQLTAASPALSLTRTLDSSRGDAPLWLACFPDEQRCWAPLLFPSLLLASCLFQSFCF
jgi:hypothetical protein